MSVDEAARFLSVSRRQVYRLIDSGELKPFRVGHRLRFRVCDLEKRPHEELLDHRAPNGAVLRHEPPLDDAAGEGLAGILRNLELATAPLFEAFDRLAEISERVREDDR